MRINRKDPSKYYDIYIDQRSGNSSKTQPANINEIARHSGMMVVVGSKESFESPTIKSEIDSFFDQNVEKPLKIIYPESLSGEIVNAVWFDSINILTNSLNENEDDFHQENFPSDRVVESIFDSFTFPTQQELLKKSERKIKQRGVIAAIFTAFALVAGISAAKFASDAVVSNAEAADATANAATASNRAALATNTAANANKRAQDALTNANVAENRAKEQAEIAANKTAEASQATARAESEKRNAANQKRIADAEQVKADKASKLAGAKTILADKEAKRADNEKVKADMAKVRADKEERTAKKRQAEIYFNLAQTKAQLKENPEDALLWLQKALETAPKDYGRLNVFKQRALQLTRNVNKILINTSERLYTKRFSEGLDKVALISSERNEIIVWNLKTGQSYPKPALEDRASFEFANDFKGLIFSPDGRLLAALVYENSGNASHEKNLFLKVWEIATGREILNFRDRRFNSEKYKTTFRNFEKPTPLRFSPDSRSIIFGMRLRRPGNKCAIEYIVHDFQMRKRDLSSCIDILPIPDPQYNSIVLFNKDRTASVINVNRRDLKRTISGFSNLSYTADKKKIITFRDEKKDEMWSRTIKIWDLESNDRPREVILEKSSKPFKVDFIDFGYKPRWTSGDGRKIYVSKTDSETEETKIYAVDIENGKKEVLIDLGKISFNNLRVTSSTDGKFVITKTKRGTSPTEIKIWDTMTGKVIHSRPSISQVSGRNKTLATVSEEGIISIGQFQRNQGQNLLAAPSLNRTNEKKIYAHYFLLDQRRLLTIDNQPASLSIKANFQLWDIKTGARLWQPGKVLTNMSGFAIHPNGSKFATINTSKITLYKTGDGEALDPFNIENGNLFRIVYNEDGMRFVSMDSSNVFGNTDTWRIRQLKAETGKPIPDKTIKLSRKEDGHFIGFTRHGNYFLTKPFRTRRYKDIKVRRIEPNERSSASFHFSTHEQAIFAVSLLQHADGIKILPNDTIELSVGLSSFLIRSLGKQSTEILDNETLLEMKVPFRLIDDGLFHRFGIRLGRDGRLVVINDDGTMSLRNLKTGEVLLDNISYKEGASFGFLPDKKHFFTSTRDGQLRKWYVGRFDATIPEWMKNIGEALTGKRIFEDGSIRPLQSDEYLRIRRDFRIALKKAASDEDEDAEFVLRNWNP